MDANTKYSTEQLNDAEQLARLISGVAKDNEDILITMTNVFISGMEAGVMLSQRKAG